MMTDLTPTQESILRSAAADKAGKVEFPSIRGFNRDKCIEIFRKKKLISGKPDVLVITAHGRDVLAKLAGEFEEDEVEDDDEDEEQEGAGSVVKPKYREAYMPTDDTCGDNFTDAFRVATIDANGNLDMDALASVAKANGVDIARWAKLNNGMVRMNLGNMLRGMVRRGTDVVIGKATFKGSLAEKQAKAKKATKNAKRQAARKVTKKTNTGLNRLVKRGAVS